MAEEKGKLKKAWAIWEKIDEIILAGALYPFLKGIALKVFEHLGQKAEEKIGFGNVEDSRKKVEDNILYSMTSFGLSDPELSELKKFEIRLGQEEDGKNKIQALVFYVVKGLIFFKKEKDVDYSAGMVWAIKFLRQLLKYSTFEERVAFLEHEEVFSLIGQEKKTIDLLEKAKGWYNFGKGVAGKVAERVQEESMSLTADTKSFRERARAKRESRRK